jgi:hypothetical protein
MYRIDPNDAHNYDLVLDSDSLGLPMAAELIVRAVELGRPSSQAIPMPVATPPERDEATQAG